MNLITRSMELADLPTVMAIEREAYFFPWSVDNFRDCLAKDYHCLIALDQDRNQLGHLILSTWAQELQILNITIAPEYQKLGWGKALLHRAETVGLAYQCTEAFLEVRPSNKPAIGLYESAGYAEVGRRPNYYRATKGREDALMMAKTILLDQPSVRSDQNDV